MCTFVRDLRAWWCLLLSSSFSLSALSLSFSFSLLLFSVSFSLSFFLSFTLSFSLSFFLSFSFFNLFSSSFLIDLVTLGVFKVEVFRCLVFGFSSFSGLTSLNIRLKSKIATIIPHRPPLPRSSFHHHIYEYLKVVEDPRVCVSTKAEVLHAWTFLQGSRAHLKIESIIAMPKMHYKNDTKKMKKLILKVANWWINANEGSKRRTIKSINSLCSFKLFDSTILSSGPLLKSIASTSLLAFFFFFLFLSFCNLSSPL